jgi:hypothetical protein
MNEASAMSFADSNRSIHYGPIIAANEEKEVSSRKRKRLRERKKGLHPSRNRDRPKTKQDKVLGFIDSNRSIAYRPGIIAADNEEKERSIRETRKKKRFARLRQKRFRILEVTSKAGERRWLRWIHPSI